MASRALAMTSDTDFHNLNPVSGTTPHLARTLYLNSGSPLLSIERSS